MSSKRALVVDDSKSARAFLSRILERHEIAVDAAESAEAAIDYLTRHKPDVIFMDHLMPGMDGFQAVQTIKNNPRTSSIPILMYTSQEGDLYLGQARALGAEGVLPKQIKQSDVTRMLFQLRLVSDRRELDRDQTTYSALQNAPDLAPANESAIIVAPVVDQSLAEAAPSGFAHVSTADPLRELLPKLSLEIRAAVDASLQKELASLRGFIGGAMNTHTERLHGDLAALLPAPRTPEVDNPPPIVERSWSKVTGWTLAVIALAGASVMSWLWWQRGSELAALDTDLTAAYAELETLRARPVAVPAPTIEAVPVADPNAVTPAADAPDAAAASAGSVELVPNGAAVISPATAPISIEQGKASAPAVATPSAPAATSATPVATSATAAAPTSIAPTTAPATETRASQ
ncbi:MAG TPA: response regulator [Steroidobacteraceae bacterium]|nr:response regulator [Steroidobacteraceae bacterium]